MKSKKKVFWLALMILIILSTGITVQAARTMYVGKTYRVKVKGARKWTSKNKKIVKVTKDGKIIPLRPGTTFVKAYKKRGVTRIWITVKRPYLNKKKVTLHPGETVQLKLTGTKAVSWKSSRKSVALVSAKGLVRARKAGDMSVTCRGKDNKTYKCIIHVVKKPVPPSPTPTPTVTPTPTPPLSFEGKTTELISHRGYKKIAPENTIAAFRTAAEYGYKAVECDVRFTKEFVPVILHNSTIQQTSNGSGKIWSFTFDEVREFDFGSYRDPMYTGEKIPSFEEVLIFCKQYDLHPYVELKVGYGMTAENIKQLYDISCSLDMQDKVSWFSFTYEYMEQMRDAAPTADIGYITSATIDESVMEKMYNLQTEENTVKLYCLPGNISDETLEECKEKQIQLVARAVSTDEMYVNLNDYYTGAITDYVVPR